MLTISYPIAKKIIKRQQTLLDYTTQFSGVLEALFDVALLNDLGITDDMVAGTELKAPVVDLGVTGFYEGSVLDIITNENAAAILGGIGYMQIGTSFKVS